MSLEAPIRQKSLSIRWPSGRSAVTLLAISGCLWGSLFCSGAAHGEERVFRVDPNRGEFQVGTVKGGVLGAFAHDHLVGVSFYAGEIRFDPINPNRSSVWFDIPAGALTVRDPGVKWGERQKIESTMKGPRVMDVQQYPRIRFESSSVVYKPDTGDRRRLEVNGTLNLHGVARQIALPVTFWTAGDTCFAEAETWLRQTDYGMKPYSAGLGTIRVKDEVRISFHLIGSEVGTPDQTGKMAR